MSFYLPLAGFLVSVVLFLYSFARMRECRSAKPAPTGKKPDLSVISGQIESFKLRLKEIESLAQEKRVLQEKHIEEIIQGINLIVEKLEQADPSQLEQIQPSIDSLFNGLEKLKIPAIS
ncbi:MAG: hypothetical protein NTW04_03400 [Elusimicrobia bacterium]|nr:hypothetical protein [Elusimicrobiota bacterium]